MILFHYFWVYFTYLNASHYDILFSFTLFSSLNKCFIFLLSTLVLTLYIDVVLSLSISVNKLYWFLVIPCYQPLKIPSVHVRDHNLDNKYSITPTRSHQFSCLKSCHFVKCSPFHKTCTRIALCCVLLGFGTDWLCPYHSVLLRWNRGNRMIRPLSVVQIWRKWVNVSGGSFNKIII